MSDYYLRMNKQWPFENGRKRQNNEIRIPPKVAVCEAPFLEPSGFVGDWSMSVEELYVNYHIALFPILFIFLSEMI